jgi:hypothetical protein
MGNCQKRALTKSDSQRVNETLDGLFPNFVALTPTAPQWQKDRPNKCLECAHNIDFLTFTDNCRSCGRVFCSRCCYSRDAIHHHKICGLCMAGAMTSLRKRELSSLESRIHEHSRRFSGLSRRSGSSISPRADISPRVEDPSATGTVTAVTPEEAKNDVVVDNSEVLLVES